MRRNTLSRYSFEIGVSATSLQYARIIKLARESARDFVPPRAARKANALLFSRDASRREARLIKRQAVPRVTNDVWGGAPAVTRSLANSITRRFIYR